MFCDWYSFKALKRTPVPHEITQTKFKRLSNLYTHVD